MKVPDRIDLLVRRAAPAAIELRRQLHMNPEPSHEEHDTTAAVAERLQELKPSVLPSGTGLVADIGDSPSVALRADLDALQMQDTKDVPYRSQRPGVAHACGHDAHTAIVVGAAEVLGALDAKGLLPGGVRLIFEPAEETAPGGAVEVIRTGWLEGIHAMFGLHCDPKTTVGTIGSKTGAITSASDRVDLVLTGPGGHTARPHETVNLIEELGRLAGALPDALERKMAGHGEIRFVFGQISAGNAANVIPSSAHLLGTLRTPSDSAWQAAASLLPSCLAELTGCSIDAHHGSEVVHVLASRPDGFGWQLTHTRGMPPVINHPRTTELMAGVARGFLGAEAVVPTPHSWGGDSFGWYLNQIPGTYVRLGTRSPSAQKPGTVVDDLHTPGFDIDESAIRVGIELLVRTAVRWLDENG